MLVSFSYNKHMISESAKHLTDDKIYTPYPSMGHLYEALNKFAEPLIVQELKRFKIYRTRENKKGSKNQITLSLPYYHDVEQENDKPNSIKNNTSKRLGNSDYYFYCDSNPTLLSIYSLKEFASCPFVAKDKRLNSFQQRVNLAVFGPEYFPSTFLNNYLRRSGHITAAHPTPITLQDFSLEALDLIKNPATPQIIKEAVIKDCLEVLEVFFKKEPGISSLAGQIIEESNFTSWDTKILYKKDTDGHYFLSYISSVFDVYFNSKSKNNTSDTNPAELFVHDYFNNPDNFLSSDKWIGKKQSYSKNTTLEAIEAKMPTLSQACDSRNAFIRLTAKLTFVLTALPAFALYGTGVVAGNNAVNTKVKAMLDTLNFNMPSPYSKFEKMINHKLLPHIEHFSPAYREKIIAIASDFISSPLTQKVLASGLQINSDLTSLLEKTALTKEINKKETGIKARPHKV